MSPPQPPLRDQFVTALADMEEDKAHQTAETMLAEGLEPQSVLGGTQEPMFDFTKDYGVYRQTRSKP